MRLIALKPRRAGSLTLPNPAVAAVRVRGPVASLVPFTELRVDPDWTFQVLGLLDRPGFLIFASSLPKRGAGGMNLPLNKKLLLNDGLAEKAADGDSAELGSHPGSLMDFLYLGPPTCKMGIIVLSSLKGSCVGQCVTDCEML